MANYFNLLLFLLLSPVVLLSQNGTIKTSKEILDGELKIKSSNKSVVLFRRSGDVEFKEYEAINIEQFTIGNHIYKSIVNPKNNLKEFRELLTTGEIELFYGDSKKGYLSFYIAKGDKTYIIEQTTKKEYDSILEKQSTSHIRTLKILLFDHPDLMKLVDKTKFKSKELSSLITRYNERFRKDYKNYFRSNNHITSNIQLELSLFSKGFNTNTRGGELTASSQHPNFGFGVFSNFNYKTTFSFQTGLEINKVSTLIVEKFSLTETSIDLNHILLSIPARFNIKLTSSNLQPYISMDFVWSKILNPNYTIREIMVSSIERDAKYSITSDFSFRIGIGLLINSTYYLSLKQSGFVFRFDGGSNIRNISWNTLTLSGGYHF